MARRPPPRRNRPAPSPASGGQRAPVAQSGWRGTFESFGGFWVLGGIVAIAAIIGLMVFVNRANNAGSNEPFKPRVHTNVNGQVTGSPTAPVKIVEYGDYQCPYCRQFWANTEPQFEQEFVDAGIANFEFRDFIIIGQESETAAEGAACAEDQGFFWQMHDILYLRQGQENTGTFTASNVKNLARQVAKADPSVKFNGSTFDHCMDSHQHRTDVDKMTAEAKQLGMTSTPSFVINGQVMAGALTIDQLRSAINSARAAAH